MPIAFEIELTNTPVGPKWGEAMRIVSAIILPLLLVGCAGSTEAECGSEDAVAALGDLLRTATADEVYDLLDQGSALASYDKSRLMAILSKATVSVEDVRTTRDDPDSSRKFCTAKAKFAFSGNVLDQIDQARRTAGLEGRAELANRAGLERNASSFAEDIEYSVQPTDDGEKIVAETSQSMALTNVLGQLFATYLLSDEIRMAKLESDQAEAQLAAQEKAMFEEEQIATQAYSKAVLEEAQAENKLAAQRIKAVWEAIPPSTRERLASLQNAWNKKTEARCKMESAGTSLEPAERRATQLRCENEAIVSRANELERFVSFDDESEMMADEY